MAKVLLQLHKELGLDGPGSEAEALRLAKKRLWKFDNDRDGFLNNLEFQDFLTWTLWRIYEKRYPPKVSRRGLLEILGACSRGIPCQHYAIGKKLGAGAFGCVNYVVHRRTSAERVLKTVNKENALRGGMPLACLQREIDILAMLDHPHVLRLFEWFNDASNLYIITDICAGGELLDVVKQCVDAKVVLTECWLALIFRQILEGIGYCHSKGVMHKDLKLENVMMLKKITAGSALRDVHAVVVDVGLAELFGPAHNSASRSSQAAGTLVTMAPEVLARNFSYKCDIWSIGCMLYAMLNQRPTYLETSSGRVPIGYPFMPKPSPSDPSGLGFLQAAQRNGPPMEPIIAVASVAIQEVIVLMLQFDENKRPDAQQLLLSKRAWFSGAGSGAGAPLQLTGEQVSGLIAERDHRLWWRKTVMQAAMMLPTSKLGQLSQLFDSADQNKDGLVDCREMSAALQGVGLPADRADQAAKDADFDRDGRIEWSEFVACCMPMSHELFGVGLQTAFQEFDKDHDGTLGRQEIEQLLKGGYIDEWQMPTRKTVDAMVAELDTNSDGRISFVEFHNYFLHADDS
eukprot:TRINITY_DN25463_c0_g1_i3.p1 TRINITY_DN25463_c0_g1~~TRINITY_DN25463_c0_g1_i3.p1  ORF type:complete len:615 (-),score=120.24 TRINITY_DN25463_c0_g1_i3:914-2629(-)